MKKKILIPVLLAASCAILAADPPNLVNYQGVLRDSSDRPQTGSRDMVFRFYDAASAGGEILVDSHTGGGGNAVSVSGGLFNVQLGGGTVTDGSGAGTYTALAQVFRDFAAVWLQVEVGGEVLSPRIRVQSSAYALNASNLEGQPASSFIDVTATGQTKAGHLTVNNGIDASTASGFGINASGSQAGGAFGAGGAFAYVADTGVINTGIRAQGNAAGGWFKNGSTLSQAYAAHGGVGIDANGSSAGGYFTDNSGDYAYAAEPGYGLAASGTTYGVVASGTSSGGYFYDNAGNSASVATSSYGISANGTFTGGLFQNSTGSGQASVGNGNYGVYASGSFTGALFYDSDNSGTAYVGYGDLGISASGLQAGGHFTKPGTGAHAYIAASNGSAENGVYGLSNGAAECPGYFLDQYSGAYAYVGCGVKISGTGGVFFMQNHPSDPGKVLVYAAPEGDEIAVYTRGTARLVHGVARVKLGETFAWVANPDTGLTAQLTPHSAAVPLAVESVTTSELVVRGPAGAPPDLVFDYAVWGLRIGFEDHPVEQPKKQEAFIPSMARDDAIYFEHPGLRSFSARQRFAEMESRVDPAGAASKTAAASAALKAAIHVYDRETDLPRLAGHGALTPGAPPTVEAPRAPASAAPRVEGASPAIAPIPSEPLAALRAFPQNTTPIQVAESVEVGDVLANDPGSPGEFRRASTAADAGVVGIVAGDAGVAWTEKAPVALAGTVVLCKVDASFGAIAANDLLVASPTAGHAMRAGEDARQGTVVGKALEPWEAGTGTIRVLVMSR